MKYHHKPLSRLFPFVEGVMQVMLNGESIEVKDDSTVAQLLEQLQIGSDRVAVEVNLDIVPKAVYDSHILSAGDKIEIVHFVGGG
jgi:sulfur carrier protein